MRCTVHSFLALVAVGVFGAGSLSAQVSFIPGEQRQVPNGPTYVTGGDFNGDGINDVVVSSTVRDRVSVLFGSPTGIFLSALEIPVGTLLRGVAVGDFNGDNINDIAVTDPNVGKLFIIRGEGSNGRNDGRFAAPQPFDVTRRGPVWVATGYFDSDNRTRLDAATANGAADSFTVLVNQGGNRGLNRVGTFPVSPNANPRVILAHDLNGDRFDDLILLNTGTRGTDEVSVFLNTGTGSFAGVVGQRFVVGTDAIGMTKGDFNNDGRIDLAVVNRDLQSTNQFSISILIGGESPRFRVLPPLRLSCPSRINGVAVVCTPQDIASADFDLDTRQDLAVSFSTRSADNNSVTAGFVNVYAGLGDGRFEFATQVIVGLGPRRLAAMDFTGDAIPDIAVAEFSNNSVRVLRAREIPPRPNGAACTVGRQCESGACVNNTCCSTPSCPEGERCDILPPRATTLDGVCRPPAPNGSRCTLGAQCESGRCVDGFCCASASCPEGQFCNTGTCGPPAGNGTPCSGPEQCASGFCTDGVCCSDPLCAVNAACNIPGSEGVCTTRLPPGSPCTDAAQCCTSVDDPTQCDPSYCIDGFCCERQCTSSETCGAPGREGLCVPKPTATPTPIFTPTPLPIGFPCTSDARCISGFCTDGVCCRERLCPAGQSCGVPGFAGTCQLKQATGSPCDSNDDCETGFCRPTGGGAGVCDIPPPTPTPTRVPPGGPCSDTSQCDSFFFCNTVEGGVCCNQNECPAGQSCRVPGQAGFCQPIPPTPTPRRGLGEACSRADQCESGFCVQNVCCEVEQCEDPGERCDITGFRGFCVPPFDVGEVCQKNSDCITNLCLAGFCQAPPTAPPTPPTPLPATPTPEIVTRVDRSGGCHVAPADSGNSWWLLVSIAALTWIRRQRSARWR
ncbi:MAG: FG-GAP-like repeat-containing protein [Candidatus Binatia bacterium]|nr:FG-GAP-like repeat-containing protein [Candidatus Binatia bacterium]